MAFLLKCDVVFWVDSISSNYGNRELGCFAQMPNRVRYLGHSGGGGLAPPTCTKIKPWGKGQPLDIARAALWSLYVHRWSHPTFWKGLSCRPPFHRLALLDKEKTRCGLLLWALLLSPCFQKCGILFYPYVPAAFAKCT